MAKYDFLHGKLLLIVASMIDLEFYMAVLLHDRCSVVPSAKLSIITMVPSSSKVHDTQCRTAYIYKLSR